MFLPVATFFISVLTFFTARDIHEQLADRDLDDYFKNKKDSKL